MYVGIPNPNIVMPLEKMSITNLRTKKKIYVLYNPESYQQSRQVSYAANGGFAGTFLNTAVVCAICAAIYSLPGSKPDGVSVLAYFLTAGFCFWGITVLNIWFCFAGVLLACLLRKVNPCTQGNVFLFSTGIAPLMTDLLVRYPGAEAHGVTLFGAVLTLAVCFVIGLVLPAGLTHSPKVHKGYDLYSAAVPMGLLAFFLRAVLYRVLGGTLPDGAGVGAGDGNWAVANLFCFAAFALALVLGLAVCYAFGTAWFMIVYAKNSGSVGLLTALGWCVFPFILPDCVKMALAILIAKRLPKRLIQRV